MPHLPRRDFLRFTTLAGAGIYLGATTRLTAAPRPQPQLNGPTGLAAYRHWQAQARALVEPLTRLFRPGRASLDIAGPASANGRPADRLESFARPLLLAAHYLQSEVASDTADAVEFRERVARWFREGLVAGTTVGGPETWGPDANYHQMHVEMGLVALALQTAPEQLWQPLSSAERSQVAAWFATARHAGYVDNNHYFMAIHILEFLGKVGHGAPGDRAMIDVLFKRLEHMHRGEGWFQDGINQAFDYYNAYAFNFYGLWWAHRHGQSDPTRAIRWRDWARTFTQAYQHFFAASGEHPAFGRSITYRFNSLAPFGLAVLEDCCAIPLGRLRRLCTRNLDFFLARPIYQEQNCLAVGWLDRFDASAELYTCAGSPYWAAKGFAPLLLPSSHPFWHAPEEPLLSEIDDGAVVIPSAGLIVRRVGGEVEIINAGSQVSHTNLRYGAWKWSKTAYRTGRAFTCAFPAPTNWSPDSALTMRLGDGRVFGRHSTIPLEMSETHTLYRWALGYAWRTDEPPEQVGVTIDTGLWWNHGWILQVHRYTAHQPVVFRLGGYALPLPDGEVTQAETTDTISAWHQSGDGSVLQPLAGFSAREWDERRDDSTPRTHLASPFHATPIVSTAQVSGSGWLVALSWTGRNPDEAKPWRVVGCDSGFWQLAHPVHGDWSIRHGFLPTIGLSGVRTAVTTADLS